jgi:putative transposase
MKKTRFTEEQMVTILREADERAVLEVAKKARRERPNELRLAQPFRQPGADGRERLPQLEHENVRLKKTVADRDLELDVLKEITRTKWYAHVCAGSRSPTAEQCRRLTRRGLDLLWYQQTQRSRRTARAMPRS